MLAGVGSWVPPDIVSNGDLMIDSMDIWVRTRIGVASRHRVSKGTATGDLAVNAAAAALRSAGAATADVLIVATTTPDRLCPATAPDVAARLSLGNIAAFDLGGGCSGFLYGCEVAAGLIESGRARRVVVVGADAVSSVVDSTDRATAYIFGDGAGAAVLVAGHAGMPGCLGPTVWGSDGSLADAIAIAGGGSRQKDHGTDGGDRFVRMQGAVVLRQAVRRMDQAVRAAVDAAGWRLDDVDRLIAHQANATISSALAASLGLPRERMPSNIADTGNTAAASVPLLLADAASNGTLRPGDRVALVAFGSGLTWAATTLVWPSTLIPH
ncbi:beta-ketoacyl-ACP synthase 3 [Streptomyces sp. NPDC023838]|uniref:beta-ketoacyl-ACP synthase 3 n=1 Tax=Streptomyces sp. NPDC023838 TaxID=3154325 RepID=UPI0033FFC658